MVSIIAALDENRVIGFQNKLPWHLPEDLRHFKKITTGKVVVMGRKTYESIIKTLGHPLPQRLNVVLTKQKDYQTGFPEVKVYHRLEEIIRDFPRQEVFIAGGGTIYHLALPYAEKMYLTYVKGRHQGDTYFPEFNREEWREVRREDYNNFSFVELERRQPPVIS